MTEYESGAQDERVEAVTFEDMSIQQLRAAAKFLGIAAQRDWRAEDFVRAIKNKQEANPLTQYVIDGSGNPAPGYSRVIVHRDPSPGHKNTPVPLGLNGRIIFLPRGIEVDIPTPFVGVLQDAKTGQMQEVEAGSIHLPGGRFKETFATSYPFQVIAATPGGRFESQLDNRKASYERRIAFTKVFGRWPTDGELKEAMKQKIIKQLSE